MATECGIPFLSVKGPELLGSYVGESEANVRAAFESARAAASASAKVGVGSEDRPGEGGGGGGCAVLFFDELDSLAPRRGGAGDGGGVMERVVATLLGEMDGTAGGGGSGGGSSGGGENRSPPPTVFVMGATNRPDLLDPSLLRPGRFDRRVYLGPAGGREDRVRILLAQTRRFRFDGGRAAAGGGRLDQGRADEGGEEGEGEAEAEEEEEEEEARRRRSIVEEVVDSVPPSLSGADLSAVSKGALTRALERLCREAEEELGRLRDDAAGGGGEEGEGKGEGPTVEDVVRGWDPSRLIPAVRSEDFLAAAGEVSPSVSAEDIAKYEALRDQFCA